MKYAAAALVTVFFLLLVPRVMSWFLDGGWERWEIEREKKKDDSLP